jgi:hypothetical protein
LISFMQSSSVVGFGQYPVPWGNAPSRLTI